VGLFLPEGKPGQCRALGFRLDDGDRIELGFFRARKRDQMAAVVNDSDAHCEVQRLRFINCGIEYPNGTFSGQSPRWNRIHDCPLLIVPFESVDSVSVSFTFNNA
jgi:hypothetical protein